MLRRSTIRLIWRILVTIVALSTVAALALPFF